jgi:hypothetical protein
MNTDTLTSCKVECLLNFADNTGILAVFVQKHPLRWQAAQSTSMEKHM